MLCPHIFINIFSSYIVFSNRWMSSLGYTTRDQLTQRTLHNSQILKNIRLYSIWIFKRKIFVYFYKMHQSSKGMSEKYSSHELNFEIVWIVWNVFSLIFKLFDTKETNIYSIWQSYYTVKPLITNTSEEFIKCRLFFNEFYTILRKFQYLRK